LRQAFAAHRNAIVVWKQSAVSDGRVTRPLQRVDELEALIASRTAKR